MKLFAALFTLLTIPVLHALEPGDLRCDWGKDPLGVDSSPPRLSWKLKASLGDPADARQTAWQILAASSEEKLAADTGDLWDSGRVPGDAQLHVPYAGRPLAASQQVFWKVRVWKSDGQPGAWSPPARWTMGLATNADWDGARWLTDPELLKWRRGALGYRSQPTKSEDEAKWIQIDLGQPQPIDAIVLHGLRHTVAENLGFPRRFKVEAAATAEFKNAVLIADLTAEDFRNPWTTRIELKTKTFTARHLRLTATRLRTTDGEICLALSQIVLRSGAKNVAAGATVTASDSIETSPWSAASVTDGIGEPGVNPLANSTLLLRREFNLPSPVKRAVLHLSGLGECQISLNGTNPAGDTFLTTGWTRYDRTCLYQTLDVTRALKAGDNTLSLSLAGGTYNVQDGRYVKFVTDFRPLTAIAALRLELADGSTQTITTDDQWQAATGPTTFSNLFGGEDFDAGKSPGPWRPAVAWAGPGGTLRGFSHASPPFTGHEIFAPNSSHEIRPGVVVHDFGQNTAMVLNLHVRGPRGASVKITPGELISKDGSVERGSSGGKNVWWNYTLAGNADGESWSPRFFYQGCRYVQVETSPAEGAGASELPVVEKIESVVAHSDSAPAGNFTCSSDLFNRIRTLVRWAQRSNLAHVLTDCPHRERLGWLEQYHLNGPSLRYETDLTRLYAKTFGDMADAQEPNGFIPNVAPESIVFSGDFRASPEWSASVILAAWQHYVWTGDDTPLRGNYDVMARFLEDLARRADGDILDYGLGDWYDVGPKPPGYAQLTPKSLTATAIYQECVSRMRDIAVHLGKTEDSYRYAKLAISISEAFNKRFLDPQTGIYATGSQTAQAMPLVLGLVTDELRVKSLEALVSNIEGGGHAVTAGDIGYRYVLRALAAANRSDVVFAMVNQTEKPGYGYQLAQGATSLTEAWSALRSSSQNHFMLGQVTEWFYGDLAGLAPDPQAPGWRNIIVRPQPAGDITSASASHETPLGTASVNWSIRDGKFELLVCIPVGSTADVTLPFGKTATQRVGPGEHRFSVAL
ncbi:MAG: family 78 glycoside hydrolase catalytic domain [Verrucomicrobiota bacterium]